MCFVTIPANEAALNWSRMMADKHETHLERLRKVLLALDPTGPTGFEGLLAKVLGRITGQTFRLAGSGSQHGIDGEAHDDQAHISFEGKLYSGSINKNELLGKIPELIASSDTPDLWVVAATIEIKTQLSATLRLATERSGICLLQLDWPPSIPLPPLAVACAAAAQDTAAFLKKHVANGAKVVAVESAIDAIRTHPDFDRALGDLRAELDAPTLGLSIAKRANIEWLTQALSDRKRARQLFGQSLAPMARMAFTPLERAELRREIQKRVFGAADGSIVAICGGEGTGKSWLFAQSWLAQADRPLTLLVSAADLRGDIVASDAREFLIRELIRQTGDERTSLTERRWQRRLAQWESCPKSDSPNLVVCIDGLNQRPDFAWSRWLDGLSYLLERIGGMLVVSTRPGHFNSRLRDALVSPLHVITVKEWSNSELSELLMQRGIKLETLNDRVVNTLRNPRVLAIAFELLEEAQIQGFEELSVERLLFDHIRKSAQEGNLPETPATFLSRLSAHADEIKNRVMAQQREDQLVFESADFIGAPRYELSSDLMAVSAGRFFKLLPDDPNLYELTDDGLVLALGLSIIKALQKSERAGKHVIEELDIILEPVAALDKTAEAVFAGLLVASIDDSCSDTIRSALICSYLRLQNISEDSYPAFATVARNSTNASMLALYELSTSSFHVEHADWLTAALCDQRLNDECWPIMVEHLHRWLKQYSLDPTLQLHNTHGRKAEEVAQEREKRERELHERVEGLTSAELDFLKRKMEESEGGASSALAKSAFTLMAGMPLRDFGESLVAWAYGQSLNSTYHSPYDEFMFLIRFNNADWQETRSALLAHSKFLQAQDASRTAKWALVHILRATGTKEDASAEKLLVEELTADREKWEGWRRIETYCAVDPCDPDSKCPDNMAETAVKYQNIDLSKVLAHQAMGVEDHFLEDARPGVARFAPEIAVAVHRALIRSVLSSADETPVFRLLSMRGMSALVSDDDVPLLIEMAKKFSGPFEKAERESRDSWIRGQDALLMAFPRLSGPEQLELLMSLPMHGPPLLDLADVLKPGDPSRLEHALDRAVQSDDSDFQLNILMVAGYSDTPLTDRSLTSTRQLAASAKSSVRAQAMEVLRHVEDEEFLHAHARGSWSAEKLHEREHYFERWFGAKLLALAVSRGLLGIEEALNRIAPEHHWFLAPTDDAAHQKALARRLDASVTRMLEIALPPNAPLVEQNLAKDRKAFEPPLLSLVEEEKELGIDEFFKRMSESDEEFDSRQERGWKAYEEFEAALTKDKARLIVEHSNSTVIKACLESAPETVRGWAEQFLQLPDQKLRRIYNFGLVVAQVLSSEDSDLAYRLFRRLEGANSFVRTVYGLASVPLEALSVWNSADNEQMDGLRSQRLDQAATDQALSVEIIAANMAGKGSFLQRYAQDQIAREEPVKVARGLMVYGLGIETEEATQALSDHVSQEGLIGVAGKAALYAYERNRWAQHWFSEMCAAQNSEDFWRFSGLFLKIVDARYELWGKDVTQREVPAQSYLHSIRSKIERRIKKWQSEREKKLFGYKAPGPVFISYR